MKNVITILQGIVMGIAEVIPGVSGSTLALVMGIYDDFINLLHDCSNLAKEFVKLILGKSTKDDLKNSFTSINFRFGFFLLVGMAIAIGLFSHLFEFLIDNYPQEVFGVFFGLIVASIAIPWEEMTKRTLKEFSIIFLTSIVVFWFLGLKTSVEAVNPSVALLFFGGVIGISGMVLPGVSGSFILLLLGLYDYVIGLVRSATKFEVTSDQLFDLVIFMSGLIVGFIFFVRFIKYAYKHYKSQLMAFLVGLMIGSTRILYPYMDVGSSEKASEMSKLLPWESSSFLMVTILIIISATVVMIARIMTGRELKNLK